MDILTVIISAFGGIFLWNMFIPKKSSKNICEASVKNNENKPYVKMAPFDASRVAGYLRDQFGTTDLKAMFEYFADYSDENTPYVKMTPFNASRVAGHLRDQFGTTDLKAMLEYFSSKNMERDIKQDLER